MIYAVISKGHRKGTTFGFRTRVQSKVENAMYAMGHSVVAFHLTSTPPRTFIARVKILDRHGHRVQLSA